MPISFPKASADWGKVTHVLLPTGRPWWKFWEPRYIVFAQSELDAALVATPDTPRSVGRCRCAEAQPVALKDLQPPAAS